MTVPASHPLQTRDAPTTPAQGEFRLLSPAKLIHGWPAQIRIDGVEPGRVIPTPHTELVGRRRSIGRGGIGVTVSAAEPATGTTAVTGLPAGSYSVAAPCRVDPNWLANT